MNKTLKAGLCVIALGISSAGSAHPEPSVCQRLAGPAEHVPAVDWTGRLDDPMDKLVNSHAPDGHALTPLETRLLEDPDLRKSLEVAPEAPLGIDRLQGTNVYRIDSFQGSANCQYMVFVEASTGMPPRRLSAPFDAQACTTQYGRFGSAFGQRLFIVGGPIDMAQLARNYTISTWQGPQEGWTVPCELKLEFKQALKVSGRYCAKDEAFCKAAADLAPGIVEAYDKSPRLDPLLFTDGREPPDSVKQQLIRSSVPLAFPTFGKSTEGAADPFLTSLSIARAPSGMALWIAGRWWYGLVGVAGIGWRESTTSLLVIYDVTGAEPVPMASFQVQKYPAGPPRALWR